MAMLDWNECAMRRSWLLLIAAMLCTTVSITGLNRSIAESNDIDLTQWTPPDITTVADDPFGTLVKYGYALFTDTANEIGPMVSDPARRFAGNNLACQNCHLQGGTQPYAQKPIDTPYGPYVDGFRLEQHKYGPFGPIRAKVEELAAATAHGQCR